MFIPTQEKSSMERIFVLTYIDEHDRVEHWIRLSAVDVVECLDDWMLEDDEVEIEFDIHEFDKTENIEILRDVDVHDSKKLKLEAQKIDKVYPSTFKELPDEIFICKLCYIFTTGKECKTCGKPTCDIEQ